MAKLLFNTFYDPGSMFSDLKINYLDAATT